LSDAVFFSHLKPTNPKYYYCSYSTYIYNIYTDTPYARYVTWWSIAYSVYVSYTIIHNITRVHAEAEEISRVCTYRLEAIYIMYISYSRYRHSVQQHNIIGTVTVDVLFLRYLYVYTRTHSENNCFYFSKLLTSGELYNTGK